MQLSHALCTICGVDDCTPVAVGSDFEYRTTPEEFLAVQCRRCQLVYLNPRPSEESMAIAYPDSYHAFDFDPNAFGIIYKIRRRLEAKRLLRWCRHLEPNSKILDVGCGDGFHIELLQEFGTPSWKVEGIDLDERAAKGAAKRNLTIHQAELHEADLPRDSYDLILMIMTIEHLHDPLAVVQRATELLRERGRLVIVTDNTGSPDFRIFGNRHWGGYHFPRHLYLFNRHNLSMLCERAGLKTVGVSTAVSPVNWTYSLRNWIQDWHGPSWLYNRFSLHSPAALGAFTLLDTPLSWLGLGGILHGIFEKRASTS